MFMFMYCIKKIVTVRAKSDSFHGLILVETNIFVLTQNTKVRQK